jgi:hypothetical protein
MIRFHISGHSEQHNFGDDEPWSARTWYLEFAAERTNRDRGSICCPALAINPPPMNAILAPRLNHFLSERFFAFFAFLPDSSPAEGLVRGIAAPVSDRQFASCALNDFTRSGFRAARLVRSPRSALRS